MLYANWRISAHPAGAGQAGLTLTSNKYGLYNSYYNLTVKRKNPRTPAFQPIIKQTGFTFLTKTITCGTMSVPIRICHMPTNTPARGTRGHSWRGRFLKSTERRPSRCVIVHQTARRLKFLCLNTPCVAVIRRRKNEKSAFAATPQIGENPALDL